MKWYKTIAVHSPVLLFWFWSFKHILRKKGQKARIKLFFFVSGKRMFVCVCNKHKERIGYCLQPLQLLQVEMTGGLTENNDGDMRFGGVLDCFFRGDAVNLHCDSVCHMHSWIPEIKCRGICDIVLRLWCLLFIQHIIWICKTILRVMSEVAKCSYHWENSM